MQKDNQTEQEKPRLRIVRERESFSEKEIKKERIQRKKGMLLQREKEREGVCKKEIEKGKERGHLFCSNEIIHKTSPGCKQSINTAGPLLLIG